MEGVRPDIGRWVTKNTEKPIFLGRWVVKILGRWVVWRFPECSTVSPFSKASHLLEMLVLVDCGTKATQRWLTQGVFDGIGEH